MKGFPKVIATHEDVERLLVSHPAHAKRFLSECIAERMQWVPSGELAAESDGLVDATHKVVASKDMEGDAERFAQYELVEDKNCKLFQLGYTVKQAEKLIG